MQILKVLVRAHYDRARGFEGFPYVDLIEANVKGLEPEEAFYRLVGYSSSGMVSAKERHEYRTSYASGKNKVLMEKFGAKNATMLVEILQEMEALPGSLPRKKSPEVVKEFIPVVRLVSSYLMNNQEILLSTQEGAVLAKDYLNSVRFFSSRKAYSDILNGGAVSGIAHALELEVVPGDELMITKNQLFSPFPITPQELGLVVQEAIEHSLCKKLDLPLQTYVFTVNNILDYLTGSDEDYLTLIDYSTNLGMSIREMIELCGLKYVDQLRYFENTRCVFFMSGVEELAVYSMYSQAPEQVAYIPHWLIADLYKLDMLKTLNWDNGEPFIYYGGKKYIKKMIGLR